MKGFWTKVGAGWREPAGVTVVSSDHRGLEGKGGEGNHRNPGELALGARRLVHGSCVHPERNSVPPSPARRSRAVKTTAASLTIPSPAVPSVA